MGSENSESDVPAASASLAAHEAWIEAARRDAEAPRSRSSPRRDGNRSQTPYTEGPGLENARTYRIAVNPRVTSIPGQFIEVSGLVGDVNSDGSVNALDRSVVIGAWTGSGFSCPTDVNTDGSTNALDRSIVVGAWTGAQNCAP